MIFNGGDLSWLDVDITRGIVEPIRSRRKTTLQKEVTPTPPPPPPPCSFRSMPRIKEVEVVENYAIDQECIEEDVEDEEEEEEEEEFSGGEDDYKDLNIHYV